MKGLLIFWGTAIGLTLVLYLIAKTKWGISKPFVPSRFKYPLDKDQSGFYPTTVDSKGRLLCPCCGSTSWIDGPEGGGSQNLQCNDCFEYFNYMGPFGLAPIGDRSDVWGKKKPQLHKEEQA